MADNPIIKTYDTKYRSNMRMALNQTKPKLAPLAKEETGSGEKYLLQNIVGQATTTKRTTRNADTQYGETDHDRVWAVQPGADEYARLIDKMDQLASGIDLQGAYVMGGTQAINRAWDGAFIGGFDGKGGFYGSMLTGKDGTTSTPFAGANVVPVTEGGAGATGMNVKKVIAARTILAEGYADMDQRMFMALTAKQVEDLFSNVQVQSEDYKKQLNIRVSEDGKRLLGILGFEFPEIELSNPLLPYYDLTVDANGYRKTPFWTEDGMCMVPWEKLFTSIDKLPQKGHSTQVYARTMVTATRTDNARCGIILNN